MVKLVLSLGVLCLFYPIINGYECRDENNHPVDWFAAYKLPKVKGRSSPLNEGLAYMYITSNNLDKWQISNVSINSTNSIIGNTLRPLYEAKSDNKLFVIYNDQPPDDGRLSSSIKGHTKGVVLANSTGGLWLIHSVPKFPKKKSYSLPKSGSRFGQNFLCISLNNESLNEVGIQLQYNEVQVYWQRTPMGYNRTVPQLILAANGSTIKTQPWTRKKNILSKNNETFVSFAKSRKYKKELYEEFVAPALKTDLFVETWSNGQGKLLSNCTKQYKVYNIKSVEVRPVGLTFKSTRDHSKWAVSENSTWICIGDINRMEHQVVRGGGTTCINNKAASKCYKDIISSIEKCKRPSS